LSPSLRLRRPLIIYLLLSYRFQLDLHSFPTRRSSDLGKVSKRISNSLPPNNVVPLPLPIISTGFPLAINSIPCRVKSARSKFVRSEEHTSELQSRENLVCRLLLEQ